MAQYFQEKKKGKILSMCKKLKKELGLVLIYIYIFTHTYPIEMRRLNKRVTKEKS